TPSPTDLPETKTSVQPPPPVGEQCTDASDCRRARDSLTGTNAPLRYAWECAPTQRKVLPVNSVSHFVFSIAIVLLHFTLGLFYGPFGFHLLVINGIAEVLLHLAGNFLCAAFYLILIHGYTLSFL